ncbi:MAG: thioredoxin family protein [candidate division FCPU426 bacterium]
MKAILCLLIASLSICAFARDERGAKVSYRDGMILKAKKDYAAARGEFSTAQDLDEYFALPIYQIAQCDYMLGNWDEALKNYQAYIAKEPRAPASVHQLAQELKMKIDDANAPPANKNERVKWIQEPEAQKQAKATGKPILYNFDAAWSPPCRLMEKEVFENPSHAAWINREFLPVMIRDEKHEHGSNSTLIAQLQTKYKIKDFPTLVVYRPGMETSQKSLKYEKAENTLRFLRSAQAMTAVKD